jgi:hypothetical protein
VFAVAVLDYHGVSKLVVKAIIQNYDGAIKLITEQIRAIQLAECRGDIVPSVV